MGRLNSLRTCPRNWRSNQHQNPYLRRSQEIIDEEIKIPEDQYHAYAFDLNVEANVTVRVDGLLGPAFEFWTMRRASFHEWEKAIKSFSGGKFEYIPQLSHSNIHEFTGTAALEPGRYYVAIDNSDQGEVSPPSNFTNDELTVRLTISVIAIRR